MATTTRLDVTQYGKRFICLEHTTAPLKSVLARRGGRMVKHSFSIDGKEVDEDTFFKTQEENEERYRLISERYERLMNSWEGMGSFDLAEMEAITDLLTPEEKQALDHAVASYQVEIPEGAEELGKFVQLAGCLSLMLEQRMKEEWAALINQGGFKVSI